MNHKWKNRKKKKKEIWSNRKMEPTCAANRRWWERNEETEKMGRRKIRARPVHAAAGKDGEFHLNPINDRRAAVTARESGINAQSVCVRARAHAAADNPL